MRTNLSKPLGGYITGEIPPQLLIYYSRVGETWFCVAADSEDQILAAKFALKGLKQALEQTGKCFEGWQLKVERQPKKEIQTVLSTLARIWRGEGLDALPRLSMETLPPFNRRVLDVVLKIPKGFVSTYREVAMAAGSPRAVRAVGNALAANPFTLIVPCHRVVRTDLSVGGYWLGAGVKEMLLRREGVVFRRNSSEGLMVEEESVYKFSRLSL
ncbi:MAG: MGMT family protein [Candidatus Bathyarchaeia archaeon]